MQMMFSVTHPDLKINVTLCPVVIPDDIKWLQQWTGLDAGCLISFYESIRASSFIEAMMAWNNEQPVLQVDICESMFDDVGAGELIGPGDYTLRFQFAPHAPVPVLQQALNSCIDYLFQVKKANRIFIQVHRSNKLLLDWLKPAKFAQVRGFLQKPRYFLFVRTR
jgi:hypothetical protein